MFSGVYMRNMSNNNNRISGEPHGRNFRGAEIKHKTSKNLLNKLA